MAKLSMSLHGAYRLMGLILQAMAEQNLSVRWWAQQGHQVTLRTRTSSSEVGACGDAVAAWRM